MISINREKAESITLDRIRFERVERFNSLDVDTMIAISRGDSESLERINAEKESLRSVTDKDISSLTLDELAGLTLDSALSL